MSPVIKWIAPLAAVLILSSPAAAQTEADRHFTADVDAFIRAAMAEVAAVPGLSIAVVEGAEPLHIAGYGVADVRTGAPVDADTAFYIASSTKSFTALAVAALDAGGVLDLDAPVASWSGEGGLPPEMARQVSLADLLSHRSGLDNSPMSFRAAMTGDHTPELMFGLLGETVAREDTPYGTFRYSNAGYNIATTLLEQRFGRDWRTLVEDEVLDPIGMTSTTARISAAQASGRTLAVGHEALEAAPPVVSPLQKVDATMQSAGGLLSTASDMALWLEVQLNDGVLDGRRVFPEGLVTRTHAPLVDSGGTFGPYTRASYGMGWQIGGYGDDVLIHHFGNFAGSRAHVSFMPDRNLGVAVMVNEDLVTGDLADLVANYVYDRRAGGPEVNSLYEQRLDELVARRDQRRAGIAAGRQSRTEREWTLSQPTAAYAGVYESPALGRIRVDEADGQLTLSMGVLSAVGEPFPHPDAVRVELVPFRGEVIVFTPDGTGAVTGLTYQEQRFDRR